MEKEFKDQINLIKAKAELKKWHNEKAKPKPRFYIFYFLIILCLAYITDEIATNVNGLMQSNALTTFFDGDLNKYTLIMTLCSGVAVFTFFFRALADRYGRKPFLIINVVGMAVGMFTCFIANSLPLYVIGLTISFFFTPCDVQVIYIIETSSEKRRALNLSISKAIGILGVVFVPIFYKHLASNGWQYVFLVPAIVGLLVGVLGFFFARESDAFVEERIDYLNDYIREASKTKREKDKKTKKNSEDKSQGGILAAIKYMFKHKVLLWLFLVTAAFAISSIGSGNYSVIMCPTAGYEPMSEQAYNQATFIYPLICALVILLNGIISDVWGRKIAAIFDCSVSLIMFIFFIIGVRTVWDAYVIGVFLGGFIGGYLSGLDTINVLCSEKSPTNLRSSIMSVISVGVSGGTFLATGILMLFNAIIPNLDVGILSSILIPPTLGLSLFALLAKIPETKGTILVPKHKEKERKGKQ